MSERATLAILDDGKFIVGLPPSLELPKDEQKELLLSLKNHLKLWSFPDSNADVLLFPFPIDVIDLRTKHDRPKELDAGTD